MSPVVKAVSARMPWEGTQGRPEIPQKDEAPRKTERFRCPQGHKFDLTFALNAEVPVTWDCRHCGGTARLEGAPEGAEGRPELPGLTSGSGRHARSHASDGTSPWEQLMKNVRQREPGYEDDALAEALVRARQARGAR